MPALVSSSPHRVVITGAGIITSMGIGWRANADGFRAGRSALRQITLFDASRQRVQRAGEVLFDEPLPETRLTKRQLTRLDRASRLLLYAGTEAVRQCGWRLEGFSRDPIPLCLGTSAGAMALGEAYFKSKTQRPASTSGLAEKVMLYQPHTQAQFFMDALGITGPIRIIANACASGANAIGDAFRLIKTGRATRVIAGGYDALAEMVFAGFDSLQALSTTTPRPFDANRDGLALGEGAGVVTLERYEDAVERGADIIAEICGYGATTDLHHLTQPHPQGDAALASMTQACEEAGVTPNQVRYINSHGTGTPLNDVAEGIAIQRWAGDDVSHVMVSSTKGSAAAARRGEQRGVPARAVAGRHGADRTVEVAGDLHGPGGDRWREWAAGRECDGVGPRVRVRRDAEDAHRLLIRIDEYDGSARGRHGAKRVSAHDRRLGDHDRGRGRINDVVGRGDGGYVHATLFDEHRQCSLSRPRSSKGHSRRPTSARPSRQCLRLLAESSEDQLRRQGRIVSAVGIEDPRQQAAVDIGLEREPQPR